MSRLPQIGDDLTIRLRDMERRLAELEARPRTGPIVNPQIEITSNGPHAATAFTDYTRTVVVDPTRDYVVCLDGQIQASTTGAIWTLELYVDGDWEDRLFVHENAIRLWCNTRKLWRPTTAGEKVLTVRADEIVGAASLILEANSDFTRQFWVEDNGPRLTT